MVPCAADRCWSRKDLCIEAGSETEEGDFSDSSEYVPSNLHIDLEYLLLQSSMVRGFPIPLPAYDPLLFDEPNKGADTGDRKEETRLTHVHERPGDRGR